MNKALMITAIIATAASMAACRAHEEEAATTVSTPQSQQRPQDGAISNTTLIIMYDAKTGKEPLLKAAKEYGAEIIYQYNNLNGIALRIPDGGNISEAIKYFKAVEGVLSVSQDRQWRLL